MPLVGAEVAQPQATLQLQSGEAILDVRMVLETTEVAVSLWFLWFALDFALVFLGFDLVSLVNFRFWRWEKSHTMLAKAGGGSRVGRLE